MSFLPALADIQQLRRRNEPFYDANSLRALNLSDIQSIMSPQFRPKPRVTHPMSRGKEMPAGDTIKKDKNNLKFHLDVLQFEPHEISVKTVDNFVVVEARHKYRPDEHGSVRRYFKRRYELPEGCNMEHVKSNLSTDGVLTVIVPLASHLPNERAVPIVSTGPVKIKSEGYCFDPDEKNTDVIEILQ